MSVKLNHKIIIVGVVALVVILSLAMLTYNSEYFNSGLTWITLIISISAGIMITIIVDKRSSDAHAEVTASQEEISILLSRLDETDQKHNRALHELKESKTKNEMLAKNSIISSLEYIESMLNRLTTALKNKTLDPMDKKLISNVLDHLESPLNLIEQAMPQSGTCFQDYNAEIQEMTQILRKLILASISVPDNKMSEIFRSINKANKKLTTLNKKIS